MFGDTSTISDVRQILAKQAEIAQHAEQSSSLPLSLEQLEAVVINSFRYLMSMEPRQHHLEGPDDDSGCCEDRSRNCQDVEAGMLEGKSRDDDVINDEALESRDGDENQHQQIEQIHHIGCDDDVEVPDERQLEAEDHSRENEDLNLMELPVQVLLHIFSFLDAQDIANVGCTCRQAYSLCADQLLWRDILETDKLRWREVGHLTNPALYQAVRSDLTYKEIYMRCSPEVQRESPGFNLLRLPQLLWSFVPHKPPKVVMFGPGLERNTTTLVRKFLGSGSDVFRVRGVFPALLPGVGTGFRVASTNGKVDMRLITMYSGTLRDRESQTAQGINRAQRNRFLQAVPGSNPLGGEGLPAGADSQEGAADGRKDEAIVRYEPTSNVKELCRNVDAFIFVVDASVGSESVVEGSRTELFALLDDRWTAQKCPLVILSCVPNSDTPRVPCVTLAELMDLHKLNRTWKMFDANVADLSGVLEGVTWLVESAKGR